MEKIVVLLNKKKDEGLLNCLKELFPECIIEVHEKMTRQYDEDTYAPHCYEDPYDERLDKYLSFL